MNILISGASGLVGTSLIPALESGGHHPVRLARPGARSRPGDVTWDPASDRLDLEAMRGVEAVVHLAGASIAAHRWTPEYKQVLRSSRIEATRHLVSALARLHPRPRVLIAASAVGIYGNRGDEVLTESSPPGNGFLAGLARDWETESLAAEALGIRVVLLRFGMILDAGGGALPRLLLPFRLGLGGRVGSGRQWMSWITLADAVALIEFALVTAAVAGAVNAVAPEPLTNRDFTRALANQLHRPAMLPTPGFALRLALGEMADALLLSSQRVVPERLNHAGFTFRHANLGETLASLL